RAGRDQRRQDRAPQSVLAAAVLDLGALARRPGKRAQHPAPLDRLPAPRRRARDLGRRQSQDLRPGHGRLPLGRRGDRGAAARRLSPPTAADDGPRRAPARDPRLRLIIPGVVAIAFLMEQLDSTIVTTAIPDIARSLDSTPLRLSLAVTAYVLTLAVFIPISGWLADRFGSRRIFLSALVIFTIGSALCGLAQSFAMLVLTRALQGVGGAMMTPVRRLILLRSFPRRQLFPAITYMTPPAIVRPVIGPPLRA